MDNRLSVFFEECRAAAKRHDVRDFAVSVVEMMSDGDIGHAGIIEHSTMELREALMYGTATSEEVS